MGVRILVGHEQGDSGYESEIACLFDSVTGVAFGPVFHRGEDGESPEDLAQAFQDWVTETEGVDIRQKTPGDLERLYGQWLDASKRS
jgi:hypothetical protein